MDDFPRLQFNDEKSKKWAEEKVCDLQKITSPDFCRVIAQEHFPGLSTSSYWATLPHILLDSPFTDANIQLEEFTTNPLCSPKPIICGHLFDQRNYLRREPRLPHLRLRFVLPEQAKKLPVPAEKSLWLDQEECLFPGLDHPC